MRTFLQIYGFCYGFASILGKKLGLGRIRIFGVTYFFESQFEADSAMGWAGVGCQIPAELPDLSCLASGGGAEVPDPS